MTGLAIQEPPSQACTHGTAQGPLGAWLSLPFLKPGYSAAAVSLVQDSAIRLRPRVAECPEATLGAIRHELLMAGGP